ncbi:MAG TPA: three-Cys-motif partner protein TcmP [Burkholderiales bacterium]|nr:three-Cys-motif partner protein TcmP [Burkholderiales bacterium]
MPTPTETLWEIDPHTTAKHEILRRYLEAWFPILGSHHHRIVYIDGFAGPGRYKGGELGSPIIALNVAMNHRTTLGGELVFWFIDEREDRIEHLKRELNGMTIPSRFKVRAEAGKFHEKVGPVLKSIEADGSQVAPTFAFIDPFGFSGIPFSLIEDLLKHPRCEAFITFMVDAFNRFLEHPKDTVVQHIVDAFGTDEAIRIAEAPGNRIERLRTLYQSRLQQVAEYVRYFEMRDRNDRTQYYLFFACNHERGHLKMKEAMWKVDPDGEFRFSDATNPNQLVLFESDTTSILIEQIRKEFAGKGLVTGAQIRKFVENKTAYLKRHMTAALRLEEKAGRLKCEPTKVDGQRRKRNTFPDGARISFQ